VRRRARPPTGPPVPAELLDFDREPWLAQARADRALDGSSPRQYLTAALHAWLDARRAYVVEHGYPAERQAGGDCIAWLRHGIATRHAVAREHLQHSPSSERY